MYALLATDHGTIFVLEKGPDGIYVIIAEIHGDMETPEVQARAGKILNALNNL